MEAHSDHARNTQIKGSNDLPDNDGNDQQQYLHYCHQGCYLIRGEDEGQEKRVRRDLGEGRGLKVIIN